MMKPGVLLLLVFFVGCEPKEELVAEKERAQLERAAARRALADLKREVEALRQKGEQEKLELHEQEEQVRKKRRVYQMRSSTNGPPLTCECVGQEPCRCY